MTNSSHETPARGRPLIIAIVSFVVTSSAACQVMLTPDAGGPGATIPVASVAYRPDGSLVLFTAAGIHLFDGALTTELSNIPLGAAPPATSAAGALQYSLSADGTTAAVIFSYFQDTQACLIAIFAIPDGRLLSSFSFPGVQWIRTPTLSPDGKLLYAVFDKPMVLDTTTGATLWADDSPYGNLRILPVWSPDGATLFTVRTRTPELDAMDSQTGALKWAIDLDTGPDMNGDSVYGLAVTGHGAMLAGAAEPPPFGSCNDPSGCPFFPFWSTVDGTRKSQIPYVPNDGIYESTVDGLGAFACDNTDTCAVGLRDFSQPSWPLHLRVYKPDDGTVLTDFPSDGETPSIAISPDGQFITTAAEADIQGGAKVFSVNTGSLVGHVEFPAETF